MPAHVNVPKARQRLDQERVWLLAIREGLSRGPTDAVSERQSPSELSLGDQHPADVGSEMFERAKDISILERVDAGLADVERALRKVEGGTYGLCEACGRWIPAARLEVRPEARFCVDDQSRAEREARAG
jgi:RNA polymerase-binding transcription factor DksA